MKVLLIILQGLLLEVVSCDAKCQKGKEQEHYYIYNANVLIKVNACLYAFGRETVSCKNIFKTNFKRNSSIFSECLRILQNLYPTFTEYYYTILVCEHPDSPANLLENKLVLNILNETIPFNSRWYDKPQNRFLLFWNLDAIRNLQPVQNAFFDVRKIIQNQRIGSIFISNKNTSLMLRTKIIRNDWPFEAWKTDYEGIIATTANIDTFIKTQRPIHSFNSTIPEVCKIAKEIESTTPLFIYTCPTSIGVYSCHINISDSCENLELGESVDDVTLSSQCAYNFFNSSTSTCTNQNPNITACRKIIKVDLKNDKLTNMSSDCKYSDGLCNSTNALWRYNYNCSVKKVDKHHRKEYFNGTILIKYNNTELILEEKRTLCGENVWYTDNESIVVSETKLQCQSKYDALVTGRLQFCVPYLNNILSEQKMEIISFQSVLYYLMIAATICVMWYIFNVTLNFYSLWTVGTERGPNGYAHLMNCVSQSLTIRYLYFQGRPSEKKYLNTPSPASETYNSVENELYEKPR